MAKDPAFLFYPGDWNLGTMHLTLLEKGCYMELLILQFAKGKFTEAQAKHMLNGSFDLAWANLREKFDTDGTFYWNKRLQVEKEKRQKFTESRRSNGSIEKKKEAQAKHMLKHMEDENKDSIINTLTIDNGTWLSEKNQFLIAEQWQMKQCTEFGISPSDMKLSVNAFLIEIENKEDFKDMKELKKHWYNWYKFNKKSKSKEPELSQYQKDLLAKREMFKNKTA